MIEAVDRSRSSPSEPREQHMDALWHSLQSWHARPFDAPVIAPPRLDAAECDEAIGVILAKLNDGTLDRELATTILRVLLAARVHDHFRRIIEGPHESGLDWFVAPHAMMRHG